MTGEHWHPWRRLLLRQATLSGGMVGLMMQAATTALQRTQVRGWCQSKHDQGGKCEQVHMQGPWVAT